MNHNRLSNNKEQLSDELMKKWETEPDFVEMKFPGYHLIIRRMNDFGNLNGYVGVRMTHPYYGFGMNKKQISKLEVHGGITFAGEHTLFSSKRKYWYFGFDTMHFFDFAPGLEALKKLLMTEIDEFSEVFHKEIHIDNDSPPDPFPYEKKYRDIEYVSKEVSCLYEQLRDIQESLPEVQINHKRLYRKLKNQKRKEYTRWQ